MFNDDTENEAADDTTILFDRNRSAERDEFRISILCNIVGWKIGTSQKLIKQLELNGIYKGSTTKE